MNRKLKLRQTFDDWIQLQDRHARVFSILAKDALQAASDSWEWKSPYSRRVAVRAIQSFVETIAEHLSHLVELRCMYLRKPTPHTGLEILAARDQTISIDDSGRLRIKPLKTSFQWRIKYLLCRLVSTRERGKLFGGEEWRDFRTFVRVRNQFTHPKRASDLRVSERTYQSAINGASWFVACASKIMASKRNLQAVNAFIKEQEELESEDGKVYLI